uniref:Uncharacterized protein n=1 Tax=Romanomermis culicivorax TaxID=13658 RepID=A0A915JQL9_ROMCU
MKQEKQLLIANITAGHSFGAEEILRNENRYCTCLTKRQSALIRVESRHYVKLSAVSLFLQTFQESKKNIKKINDDLQIFIGLLLKIMITLNYCT